MPGNAIKLSLIFRITVFILNVRSQQMNDDEFLWCRVIQHFPERFQHVSVIFTRTLCSLLIHVVLFVCLARKYSEHGVAGSDCLLVGNPERFIACLLHQVHQRRLRQIQIRVLFVGESESLLQCFNCVRTRCHHIIKHSKVRIGFMQRIQLRRGFTRIPV